MSYVLSLEFIAKALRAEHEPRKDAGVGGIGVTGHLGIRWASPVAMQ